MYFDQYYQLIPIYLYLSYICKFLEMRLIHLSQSKYRQLVKPYRLIVLLVLLKQFVSLLNHLMLLILKEQHQSCLHKQTISLFHHHFQQYTYLHLVMTCTIKFHLLDYLLVLMNLLHKKRLTIMIDKQMAYHLHLHYL